MTKSIKIAVSSASFKKNLTLRSELQQKFPRAKIKYTDQLTDVMTERQLVSLCYDADYLIVGRELINASSVPLLSSIKGISKYGVGLDNIDFYQTEKFGIKVYFETGVNAWEVTELTIALMISCLRKISLSDRLMHQGIWKKDGGTNLAGKTVGLIGCGHVGTKVAGVVKAFGCRVLINDIQDKPSVAQSIGAKLVTKEELYSKSDIISLHVPLTETTKHLINTRSLTLMRTGATLINTARGPLIDEKALIRSLKKFSIIL